MPFDVILTISLNLYAISVVTRHYMTSYLTLPDIKNPTLPPTL